MKLEGKSQNTEPEALKPAGFAEPHVQLLFFFLFFQKWSVSYAAQLYDIYTYSNMLLSYQKYAHTSKQQLENISINGKPGWISISAS